jgi:hypothetical protein
MVDRARVSETVQIGLEATPGTAVAAATNLRSASVMFKMPGSADLFRPDGHKFNALAENNAEWTAFDVNGKPTYTEFAWWLAMMFGNPAPASSGVAVKTRVYEMLDTTILTPVTGTIEKGSSVRAQKLAYGLLTDFSMSITRSSGLTLTGSGIGQLFTDAITKTATPADVPLVPMMGKQFDLYIDAASANLGTTKMLRAFKVEPSITGVYGPLWAINSANPSFTAHVDLAPTTSFRITLEADAAGMAYLSQFRAGSILFPRLKATGPVIDTAIPYSFQWDAALLIKSISPDEDESGVTVVTYETEFVKDSTWGKATQLTLVNDVATVA